MQTCSGKVPKWSVAGLAGTARRRFLCSGINVPHKNLSTSLSNRVSQFSPSQRLLAVWGTNNELSGCSPQQSCNCKAHAPGGCITSCRCQEERGSENRPAASQPWMQGFRSILFASALVTVLRLNQEAWADEIPAPSDSEAFISSTYDPVISIIFGFIVLCLVIVTGGVSSFPGPTHPVAVSTADKEHAAGHRG